MIEPIYGRLLDLADQNIACARDALARGAYYSASCNAATARDLLNHFSLRLSAPVTSRPITARDNSSITTTTPTAEAAKAPTQDAGDGAQSVAIFHHNV